MKKRRYDKEGTKWYRKSELVVREGRSTVRGTAGGVGVEQSEDGEEGTGV